MTYRFEKASGTILKRFQQKAEEMKKNVLASADPSPDTFSGRCYYFSNDGADSNDGLSPQSALKTPGMVEHLPLQPVDDRDIIEYVVKGFMLSGKVIERDLVLGACKLFRGNLWYLNHFTSICDSLSKGYINEGVLMEALKSMISIHEPKFRTMVNDLTDHQLSLMRAILDGVIRFSTSEVIEKYSLNSSANVRRVKDALKKKEIITFNEKDEPVILDPLFEYWIGKYYFGI